MTTVGELVEKLSTFSPNMKIEAQWDGRLWAIQAVYRMKDKLILYVDDWYLYNKEKLHNLIEFEDE